MSRLIDADALEDDVMERYCKDCEKRKGMKRGKWRVIYEIGEAPCRACDVDDLKMELDEAPTIDAVEVVRCKDCNFCGEIDENGWHCCENFGVGMPKNGFCSDAERREDVKVN